MEKVIFALVIIIAMLLSSCGTTRGISADTGVVIEHQRAIQRIEDTAAELGEYHSRAVARLDTIGEQAAGIGDAIGRLEFSFNEYDRLVRELLAEVDRLRARIEKERQDYK